jgi:hypothetical protein
MKYPLAVAALAFCFVLSTLVSCGAGRPSTESSRELARVAVERVRSNFNYEDFTFRLKITRTFPNGTRYSKTFQFFGIIGDVESRVFAESISGPPAESSRYLMLFRDRKLVSAKMSSPSMGEMETREDDADLNKITFGNLSYPEFRHMIALRPEDFDEASQDPSYIVLHSHVEEIPYGEFEESRASRFVYYIDRESYLPARIEFFNQREKFKEFTLNTKEQIRGRWVVRSGTVKDFIDHSVTLLEFEDVRLDEGVDGSVFDEQRLRSRE